MAQSPLTGATERIYNNAALPPRGKGAIHPILQTTLKRKNANSKPAGAM